MSFKLTLTFNNYEELCKYINDIKKCERKNKIKSNNETIEDYIIDAL